VFLGRLSVFVAGIQTYGEGGTLHPGSEEHAARLWFRVYHLFQQSLHLEQQCLDIQDIHRQDKAPGHLQFLMLSGYIPHSQTVLFASQYNVHFSSVSYCHKYSLSTTSQPSSLSHTAPLSSVSVTLQCTSLDTLCHNTQCL
jgi:hypothetical protein